MIIAPQKAFLVDYKINNPADTDTHYVRAVIKNSISGVTLATLNLTDNGGGYFSYAWVTPGDPTGTGLQISIMRTVYDDASYTTESVVYGTTLENYIVRDLAGSRSTFGAAGASSGVKEELVDYKKIRAIIEEVVEEKLEKAKPDHSGIITEIGKVGEKVEGVKKVFNASHETFKTDLQGTEDRIMQGIAEVEKSEEVKSHVEEKLEDKLTTEQFNEFMNQMQDFMMNMVGLEEKSRKEIKTLFENLAASVEARVAEPVQIEFKTPSMEAKRTEPEQKPVNPREAILSKLLTT